MNNQTSDFPFDDDSLDHVKAISGQVLEFLRGRMGQFCCEFHRAEFIADVVGEMAEVVVADLAGVETKTTGNIANLENCEPANQRPI